MSPNPYRNRVLSRLSVSDLRLLRPHLEPADLSVRQRLEVPDRRIEHIYFIEHGVASVVASDLGNQRIEVGIIGREGVTGLPVVMGTDRSPNDTYMQIAGDGLRIGAGNLRREMGQSATLRRCLLNYAHAFMIQTGQTAIANGRRTIEERLARWLLMAHDRVDGDELPLTHDFLAVMLGVRRSGVTAVLRRLEKRKLLRATRGVITIADRQGLEQTSKGAYGVPEAEFRRLFG